MASAQLETAFWFFGDNASLQFTPDPMAGPIGSLNTFEGSSTISDACGNLLFYSDGVTVWDTNGVPLPNGNGLVR